MLTPQKSATYVDSQLVIEKTTVVCEATCAATSGPCTLKRSKAPIIIGKKLSWFAEDFKYMCKASNEKRTLPNSHEFYINHDAAQCWGVDNLKLLRCIVVSHLHALQHSEYFKGLIYQEICGVIIWDQ